MNCIQSLTNGLGLKKAHKNTKIARLSNTQIRAEIGSMLRVNSADLRWTHDKNQRVFTFGRRLEDVVTDLRRSKFLPSQLHDKKSALEKQVVLMQQSKALLFQRGGCNHDARPRGLKQACFSARVDHTY